MGMELIDFSADKTIICKKPDLGCHTGLTGGKAVDVTEKENWKSLLKVVSGSVQQRIQNKTGKGFVGMKSLSHNITCYLKPRVSMKLCKKTKEYSCKCNKLRYLWTALAVALKPSPYID